MSEGIIIEQYYNEKQVRLNDSGRKKMKPLHKKT